MKVVPLLTLDGKVASESLMVVLSMYIYIIKEHTNTVTHMHVW